MTLQEGYRLLGGDLPKTLARLGDSALLMKHLRQLTEDDALIRLKAAVAAQDRAGAWQAAHMLLGSCQTLGLDRLAVAAERIMAADWPEVETPLALLEREFEYAAAIICEIREGHTALLMLIHELRTPLQVILGTAGRHRDSDGMEQVTRAANHLTVMLSALEGLATAKPGQQEMVDLPNVLRSAVELLEMNDGKVTLETDLRHERVLGDPAGLTQVLLNLLTNAARHAPQSNIMLRAVENDEDFALSVQDFGPGMSDAEMASAFKPYWQAGSGLGMGLGMPIVRGLAAQMGGCVAVKSVPGEGTTVTVRLPMTPSDTIGKGRTGVEKARRFNGLHALLVEDDRLNAEVSAELLTDLGLRTSVARDGGEAVRLARRGGYDCVFLDAHMPGMRGGATVSDIRHALPETPIFALTGGMLPGEEEQLRSAGLRECLIKPVGAEGLTRVLDRYFPNR